MPPHCYQMQLVWFLFCLLTHEWGGSVLLLSRGWGFWLIVWKWPCDSEILDFLLGLQWHYPHGKEEGCLVTAGRGGIPSFPVISTDTVGGPYSWLVGIKVPALCLYPGGDLGTLGPCWWVGVRPLFFSVVFGVEVFLFKSVLSSCAMLFPVLWQERAGFWGHVFSVLIAVSGLSYYSTPRGRKKTQDLPGCLF